MTRPERAMQIWQVLIGVANNRQILTYEGLGKLIGMGAGTLSQSLGYIMRYCDKNDLPPLTVLVVKKTTGLPGTGLTTIEDLNSDREAVFRCEWFKLKPLQVKDFEELDD